MKRNRNWRDFGRIFTMFFLGILPEIWAFRIPENSSIFEEFRQNSWELKIFLDLNSWVCINWCLSRNLTFDSPIDASSREASRTLPANPSHACISTLQNYLFPAMSELYLSPVQEKHKRSCKCAKCLILLMKLQTQKTRRRTGRLRVIMQLQ